MSTEVSPDIAQALSANAERIRPFGSRLLHLATAGSTNDVAGRLAGDGAPEGMVVIADAQTAGRGRRGHTWHSPPLAGLYVSVVLRPSEAWLGSAPESIGLITLAAGVAVAEGVRAAGGPTAEIKWPNDVVVGGREPAFSARHWRKLAGILAEGAAAGDGLQHVVLGFGINVARVPYPAALSDQITSVEHETGRSIGRVAVLLETLAALAHWYAALASGDTARVIARWRALSPSAHGAPVAWTDAEGLMEGVTAGVDRTGALLAQTIRGDTHVIRSGEVTWL